MQIFSRRSVQVGVLIFMTIALALSAQAATFSKASLKGSYSLLVNKWTADPNVSQGAEIGVAVFDGAGNATESYTEIANGVVWTGTDSGKYVVNADGTGGINWTNSGTYVEIALNSTVAKVAHDVALLAIDKNGNEVVSGIAVLQSTTAATYTVASVKGSCSVQWNTWTANVNQPQDGGVGVISFDGKGNVNGSLYRMYGGVEQTGTVTGTYTVNPDGSGSISLSNGSQDVFVLNSVTAGLAKGSQFLQTNTNGNIVTSGVVLKQ